MSLPDGVTTCLLTYGPITDTFGNLADSITVEVVADRTIVHAASGRTLFKNPVSVTADGGGVAQLPVPHTDQAGFRDQQQNTLTGWYYTVRLTARFGNGIQTDTKTFQPLVGQTTVDADLLPSNGMVTPGVTAPTATVTSVNGQTGAVDLSATFVSFWTPSTAVLAGALRVAPTGQTIQRKANGTTGATYDTAEAALWTVVTGAGVSGLPTNARIDIVTAGQAEIVSKETYLPMVMTISGVPGVADLSVIGQIRGRGNNSWLQPKKPYKIKLASKVSLMGMDPFDDWALLTNYIDPSFTNTALAFDLGQGSDGLDWTPDYRFADLYLNGEYMGLYQLVETVKRGTARVNIDKAGTTGLALTGGYMLELDARETDPGWFTTQGVGIIYDDPDGTVSANVTYIQSWIQTFEDTLYGSSWLDPTTGYARFIDRDSFIDWYLIEELGSNQDSGFNSSCKCYKTRDTSTVPGRLFMGPLWDFDLAFGTVVNVSHPPEGFHTRVGAIWYQRLFQDATFAAAVGVRWTALLARITAAGGVSAMVDRITAQVAPRGVADQERWAIDADWATLAAFKKSWINARIEWLTGQFVTPTTAPGAISALAAGTPTTTSVGLSWVRPTFVAGASAAAYSVQYRIGAGSWTSATDAVTTSTSLTGLTPATTYEVRVAAKNAIGTGPYSTVSVTTASAEVPGSFSDSFDRADSTSTLGADWAPLDGTWGIIGGHAYSPVGGSVIVSKTGIATGDYRVTVTKSVDAGDNGAGIIVRAQDTNNYYVVLLSIGGGITLYAKIAGGFTNLGGVTPVPVPAGATITVEVEGTSIRVFNGASQIGDTIDDATFASGPPGLRSDTGAEYDDFIVAPL